MGNLTINRTKTKGRHHITISATPKSPATHALMRQFHAGVKKIETKWRASISKVKAKKAKAKAK